jgi:hypothetical protein
MPFLPRLPKVFVVGVAGIISTLLAASARYLIGAIESAQLTPLITVIHLNGD